MKLNGKNLLYGTGAVAAAVVVYGLYKASSAVADTVSAGASSVAELTRDTTQFAERHVAEAPNIFAAASDAVAEVVTGGKQKTLGGAIYATQEYIAGLFK